MTPACATWCTKWWMCSWFYWISTSSSTMITFSVVHGHLRCHCCALIGAIFKHIYFARWAYYNDTYWVWWNFWWQFYRKFSRQSAIKI